MKIVALISIFLSIAIVNTAFGKGRDISRGKYIFNAAGCAGCHTDYKSNGHLLAGGRRLSTPFGTFYGPNITPSKKHGIGKWTPEDFIKALRFGVAPDGKHYYPVFPYTAYTQMTEKDILDLRAYIFSLPAIEKKDIPHKIKFPFNYRVTLGLWKYLYLNSGVYTPEPDNSLIWNRGAYVVRALSHCGECHTPRNLMGNLIEQEAMAGGTVGTKSEKAPNITPDKAAGIGNWSNDQVINTLMTGMLPDGDFVGGHMAEVVNNTSKMTKYDLSAITIYLRSLPAIGNK